MFEQLAALRDELDRLHEEFPKIQASGDRRAARDAGRRLNELEPVVTAYQEWLQVTQALADARTSFEAEPDTEMKDLWRTEIAELEPREMALEARIKDLLLPRDPNEGR